MTHDMQDSYLLQQLTSSSHELTKTERRLQEYILKHAASIRSMRILSLEQRTGVSKSTISRYCKKMGFSSFREFSVALAQEVALNYSNIHMAVNAGDNSQTIAKKLCVLESETLNTTFRMLDYSRLDQAVDLILSANIIHVFAVGGAVAIAQDFYHKMLRIGKKVAWEKDYITQQMQARTAGPEDVALICSISGYENGLLDMAALLQENHTHTICITNGYQSAVAMQSDISLYGAYRSDFTYTGTIESRLSLMYIVDLLFILLSMKGAPETTDKIKLTKEVLEHNKRQK